MVEFPLVARRAASVFAPPERIYPRTLPPADIKILSSGGVSGLAGTWETNTSKASSHARLNVALQRKTGQNGVNPAVEPATFCHKFRNTVAGFWFSASKV